MSTKYGTWIDQRNVYARTHMDQFPGELSDQPVIRIQGERQTGKTEMMLDRMVRHASDGLKVAYVANTFLVARNTFDRLENRDEYEVSRYFRGNGNVHADFHTGGSIWFLSKDGGSFRGRYFDVVVWDDVQKPIHPDVFVAAKLIYEVTT